MVGTAQRALSVRRPFLKPLPLLWPGCMEPVKLPGAAGDKGREQHQPHRHQFGRQRPRCTRPVRGPACQALGAGKKQQQKKTRRKARRLQIRCGAVIAPGLATARAGCGRAAMPV